MKVKNKNILALFLFIISFSLIFAFVFAKEQVENPMEVEYPTLNEMKITQTTSLPEYVKYIFYWGIIIGAIIAFGSLIYAGIRYLTSTGNPEALKDAKGQIFAAFMGLIILLASGIIFNTINPQITTISLVPVTLKYGVRLIYGEKSVVIGVSYANLEKTFPSNFKPTRAKVIGPDIKARAYNGSFYTGDVSPWFIAKKEMDTSSWSSNDTISDYQIRSIEIGYANPGIYLYNMKEEVITKKGKNEMRREINLSSSVSDFTNGNWRPEWSKFIQIKNREEKTTTTPEGNKVLVQKPTDFLTMVCNGINYVGCCRLFFEKKQSPLTNNIFGNLEKNEIAKIVGKDKYMGKEDYELGIVNSVKIFNLSRTKEDLKSCQITFFENPNYQGEKSCTIQGAYLKPGLADEFKNDTLCKDPGMISKAKSLRIDAGNCIVVLITQYSACYVVSSPLPDLKQTGLFRGPWGWAEKIDKVAIYPVQ